MFFLVSAFLFLWQRVRTRKVLHLLGPYGKMSLTNYITQSIVGSFLYFGYGLSLFDNLCTTESFILGVAFFALQLSFCHWWLQSHKYGPFEYVWRKLTWLRMK